MNIQKATREYEQWLANQIPVISRDLALKHERMAEDRFAFLRATFYRWVEHWLEVCPTLSTAPSVLGVGDLHIENYGTWRDVEGRLIWGINDFDEAAPLPYTHDLVRLAASALVASEDNHLQITSRDTCDALLDGYRQALATAGRAFVLAEHHAALRSMASGALRDPIAFWQKLDALPTVRTTVSRDAIPILQSAFPEPALSFRLVHRLAGLGSLGRPRLLALANWRGARVAREVKSLVPSAWLWRRRAPSKRSFYNQILRQAIRVPDPFVGVRGSWILRRLAPDCSRIALPQLPKRRDEWRLLHAMGWETANVHIGTANVLRALRHDLRQRPTHWLSDGAARMADAVTQDWRAWRRG